jgi:transposase
MKRGLTVERIREVQRLIDQGLSDRVIARALSLRRTRVSEIRKQGNQAATLCVSSPEPSPDWSQGIDWESVLADIRKGYEIKRIWEEQAKGKTGYVNFWKYVKRTYPALMKESVTLRDFVPGGHTEVDWAGKKVQWVEGAGKKRRAHLFLGILCFSQKIFAWASENEKKENWGLAHRKMWAAFSGSTRVTVPDNLKSGVSRTHLYDPDINPGYLELALHFSTVIVPGRVKKPKDKALIEGAVKIVCRYFFFLYRKHTFRSLAEINEALARVVERLNTRPHSRFGISRQERFEKEEKGALQPLPDAPFEQLYWKTCRVHPDCTICLEKTYYSVPYRLRDKEVRVKVTLRQVEIFEADAQVALHSRDVSQSGHRILDNMHLPPNSRAYRENIPQYVLSQAKALSPELHALLDELFQEDALGHLRRAQGLIRTARKEVVRTGAEIAGPNITLAVAHMRRFQTIRVATFGQFLEQLRPQVAVPPDREVVRQPGNPMLRKTPSNQFSPPLQPLETR